MIPRLAPSAFLLLSACQGLSPIGSRIDVGAEPFAVIVGEGPDGQTDLFALPPDGGQAVRLTFTRPREGAPSLHPAGGAIAFLRRPAGTTDSAPAMLVLMNLVNSAERQTALPATIGIPRRIGWSRDGSVVFVLGDSGVARSPAPPQPFDWTPVEVLGPGWAEADTATSVLLGDPPFARVETCARDCITSAAMPWCVVTPDGKRQELGRIVSPFRWGPDSLAYVEGGVLLIRPLAGGRPRRGEWDRMPARPTEGTYWVPAPPAG